MTALIAVEAAVLILLGLIFALDLYGDSLWLGVFMLSAGVIGCWLALRVHRLKRRAPDGDTVTGDAPKSATHPVPGRRMYPIFIGAGFFLIGTLAEDVAVGIMAGLAGFAFGYIAMVPIEPRRRRRRNFDADESDQDQIRR